MPAFTLTVEPRSCRYALCGPLQENIDSLLPSAFPCGGKEGIRHPNLLKPRQQIAVRTKRSLFSGSLFVIQGTVARQAPLSIGWVLQARRLEWVASPPPGHLPDPEIEPRSPAGGFFTSKPLGKPSDKADHLFFFLIYLWLCWVCIDVSQLSSSCKKWRLP